MKYGKFIGFLTGIYKARKDPDRPTNQGSKNRNFIITDKDGKEFFIRVHSSRHDAHGHINILPDSSIGFRIGWIDDNKMIHIHNGAVQHKDDLVSLLKALGINREDMKKVPGRAVPNRGTFENCIKNAKGQRWLKRLLSSVISTRRATCVDGTTELSYSSCVTKNNPSIEKSKCSSEKKFFPVTMDGVGIDGRDAGTV